jgi:phenazine biosynthesis protein phzE
MKTETNEAIRMLNELSETASGPFALLYRPESNGPGKVDLLRGEIEEVPDTQDIPQPEVDAPGRHDMLVVLPYRLIAERGYDCRDDGEPVLAMTIRRLSRSIR